ncbi:MAG: uncharacterized protein JWR62_3286 [Modestobacter sp.]|nr:uncharacterized protein [Modestobacter sp.]
MIHRRLGRRGCPAVLALAISGLLAGCTPVVAGHASPAPLTLAETQVATHPAGQGHTRDTVDYPQTPPVGGRHDPSWADCTGTVYSTPIRQENAVHSLEHGAVWITYDPALADEADVEILAVLVAGRLGLMLSPYPDQGVLVSLQAWDHQVQVDDAADPRVAQFAEMLAFSPETTPEPGATCENPLFLLDRPQPA